MSFQPVAFGNYVLLLPIARGGMAEIYLARLAKKDSPIERIVVIKKIIEDVSNQPDFVSLFEKEIHISLGLNHPNIVQTYDYGKIDGQYFLALEYVPGKNLSAILKTVHENSNFFPIELSCFIVGEIAKALWHAHSFRDPIKNTHLSIIHRDISPQNILVSQFGTVKLFDFGIAKIEDERGNTRTGIIRGKPAYLSPEQALRKELDGRSDLFSLGIVLWEMLTGHRLFLSDSDQGFIQKILSEPIFAPSSLNPKIPKELDLIVLKALERDKYQRYQLAQEFHADIHHFLYKYSPEFTPDQLTKFYRSCFQIELEEEEALIQKQLRLSAEVDFDIEQEPTKPIATSEEATLPGIQARKTEKAPKKPSVQWDQKTPSGNLYSHLPQNTNRRPFRSRTVEEEESSSFQWKYAIIPVFMLTLMAGYSYVSKALSSKGAKRIITSVAIEKPKMEENATIFDDPTVEKVTFRTDKIGYSVLVNGKPADVVLDSVAVPKDKMSEIRVRLPGHEELSFQVKGNTPIVLPLAFEKQMEKGLLFFTTTPSADLKLYRGEKLILEQESPIEGVPLPPGSYTVELSNPLIHNSYRVEVDITSGKATRISKSLK